MVEVAHQQVADVGGVERAAHGCRGVVARGARQRDVVVVGGRDGERYLRLTLADCTGQLVTMIWEDVAARLELCTAGVAVRVAGRFERHPKWGPQLALRAVARAPEGSYDPADLRDGPPRPVEAMEADLRDLVATVQDPHLQGLLELVLGPRTDTWARFRCAPAAKFYHHAYAHGLLEHSLTVAQVVSAIASTFPGIDRDLAVTGALLHDIGKLEAYTDASAALDLTDFGRLQGEIPLGYYRIRREIEDLARLPGRDAQALLHIILGHHGSLEHGSPVVPATREAWLVHVIDNLSGKLGSFDRLEKGLAPGAAWTGFDRGVGASAYFGPPKAVPAPAEHERRAA